MPMINFSKAFDMVDHIVLVEKLQLLGLPANMFSWLISFLTGHVQYCKVNNVLSKPRNINLSIVQGSGLGPSLYVIMECDLQRSSLGLGRILSTPMTPTYWSQNIWIAS